MTLQVNPSGDDQSLPLTETGPTDCCKRSCLDDDWTTHWTDVCDERRSLSAIIARLEMSVDVTPSFLDDGDDDDEDDDDFEDDDDSAVLLLFVAAAGGVAVIVVSNLLLISSFDCIT